MEKLSIRQLNIIQEFKDRLNEGKSIKYSDLKKENSSLLYAIERHFGGILKISKIIGISEEDLIEKHGLTRNINKKTLSEDEIYNRLIYLKSIGKLTTNAMRKEFNDLRLELSIKKLHGSVENCLNHYGLERDRVVLSKEQLILEVKELFESNYDLTYKNMYMNQSKLMSNCVNKFKTGWYDFLESIDINVDPLRKPFNQANIKSRLNELYNKFGELNYNIIKQNDSSLCFYAHGNFENGVYEMLDTFNIPYTRDYNLKDKGFDFEKIFKNILELMGENFRYNKHFNKEIRPDFVFDNNIWIDTKLSSWTNTIDSTIEKYTPHCKKLIIVYLRGTDAHLKSKYKGDNNVEFRPIEYYYPFIYQINRLDLIDELENLKIVNF